VQNAECKLKNAKCKGNKSIDRIGSYKVTGGRGSDILCSGLS